MTDNSYDLTEFNKEDFQADVLVELRELKFYGGMRASPPKLQPYVVQALLEAREIVKKKTLRQYLCPALQTSSNDVFEMAKIAIPIMLSLALAGTILIPVNTLIFASIILMIQRMGVATYCHGFDKEEKKDSQPSKKIRLSYKTSSKLSDEDKIFLGSLFGSVDFGNSYYSGGKLKKKEDDW